MSPNSLFTAIVTCCSQAVVRGRPPSQTCEFYSRWWRLDRIEGLAYVAITLATCRHRAGAAPSTGGTLMKAAIALAIVATVMLGGVDAALGGDLKDKLKIEIDSTE